MQLILIVFFLPLANCFICNGWGERCHVSFQRQRSGFPSLTSTLNCPRKALRMASLSTLSDVEEITMTKNSLLQVAAVTERGQLASEKQRKDVELLVGRLEELKEAGGAFKDESMALVGREGIAEKIFSFTDELPNAKIGQARQIINEDCTELLSRVDMSLWPHRWISGVVETRSRIVNDDVGDRLEVIVDSTSVKESILGKISSRLEGWRVPVDQLSERMFDRIPRIVLETVYLDQDMRVSRLPDQNFLVYVK